jgi:hypothetical protein
MPEQASLLQQGSSMGVLHLVLRHPDETTITEIPTISEADVRKTKGNQTPIIPDLTERERYEQKLAVLEKDLRDEIKKLKDKPNKGDDHGDAEEGREFTIIRGAARSYGRVVHPVEYPATPKSGALIVPQ